MSSGYFLTHKNTEQHGFLAESFAFTCGYSPTYFDENLPIINIVPEDELMQLSHNKGVVNPEFELYDKENQFTWF